MRKLRTRNKTAGPPEGFEIYTHTHTYTYIKLAKFIHEPAAKPLTYQIGLGQLKLIYGPGMGSYAGRRIFAVIVAGNNFVSGPIGKRLFSSLLRFRFFFSRRGKIAGIDERRQTDGVKYNSLAGVGSDGCYGEDVMIVHREGSNGVCC